MYRIKITPNYYSSSLPPRLAHYYCDDNNNPIDYDTEDEAQAVIDDLNSGPYYLAHGEYASPDYNIIDMDGGNYYEKPNPFLPDNAEEINDQSIIDKLAGLTVQPHNDGMSDDSDAEYWSDTMIINGTKYGIMYAVDPLDIADHCDDLGACDWSRYICYKYNY